MDCDECLDGWRVHSWSILLIRLIQVHRHLLLGTSLLMRNEAWGPFPSVKEQEWQKNTLFSSACAYYLTRNDLPRCDRPHTQSPTTSTCPATHPPRTHTSFTSSSQLLNHTKKTLFEIIVVLCQSEILSNKPDLSVSTAGQVDCDATCSSTTQCDPPRQICGYNAKKSQSASAKCQLRTEMLTATLVSGHILEIWSSCKEIKKKQ